jgi:hypothetical protein
MSANERTCSVCRAVLRPMEHGTVCYGCHLDGLVPRNYQAKEVYVSGNATERPPTGVHVLDVHLYMRLALTEKRTKSVGPRGKRRCVQKRKD